MQAALAALSECAKTGKGNLLDLTVQAMRLRATVGEVSDALEAVWGRHRADTQKVSGVYAAAYDSAEGWEQLKSEIAAFAEEEGRRPRVMIAKLGQDGHDRGAKVVATRLRRPRLRRRHRPAVPDRRGMRPPGDRERRATRSASRPSPPAT